MSRYTALTVTDYELFTFIKDQPADKGINFQQAAGSNDGHTCGCLFYQYLQGLYPKANNIICATSSAMVFVDDDTVIWVWFPVDFNTFGKPCNYGELQQTASQLYPRYFQDSEQWSLKPQEHNAKP